MRLQLVYADGLSNDNVGLEVNAHLAQVVYFHVNNLVWQTELGDTVFQYAANLVQSLEHVDIVAVLHHVAGKRKTGRTAANHGNLLAV